MKHWQTKKENPKDFTRYNMVHQPNIGIKGNI